MTSPTSPTGEPESAEPPSPGLARSTAIQAAGTALSRITGFGRIFAFAYALGAGRLADTYTLANNTPNIIYELILGGVLSGTLLPVFVRELRGSANGDEAERRGWRAVSAVFTLAVVAASVLALAFVVVAPLFIRLYTLRNGREVSGAQVAVATDLLRLFAPQVFFYGMISVTTAIVRARRKFAAPMFAPVLNNVVLIGLFLAYPSVVGTRSLEGVRGDRDAVLLLGLMTTAGVAAMALVQFPFRIARRHLRWVWAPGHPAVRTIVRLSGWTVAFVLANQVALFVVYLLANGRPGDVTVYFLTYTIFLLPHGVVSVSIISAVQPELADRWAAGDLAGFRSQLSVGIRSIAALLIPAVGGYIILARPIIAALLEHGALEDAGADRVAATLALMSIGLPAFSCWLFLTSAYQAMQNTRSLFFLYLAENGANIVAAVVLYPAMGVRGLGLAFAIAYFTGSGAALADLRRRTGGVDGLVLTGSLLRILAATAVMAVAALVVSRFLAGGGGFGGAVDAGVSTVAGVTVYLLACKAFGVRELRSFVPFRRRSWSVGGSSR
ncbi:MAG TPA: murein biosynthesis integral membrane protein MurJ [Acidimicrobiales bacterium]|nr:murein biosynthesis integral membrane protein MurJ [Acidimicrobiales bacterium]